MAEYGNREIGIVQDALKEIYDELLDGGGVEFRKNLLRNLMQSMETKPTYTTHAVAVFDAYQPLEKNFGNLNLETMINYSLSNLEVLIEMEQLDNMRQPDQMWTGYVETSEAIVDIANALNEDFDFEIDINQDIYDITREMSEQLEGSNIKVQDVPYALELQIRTLDDMKYFEFGSITAAFHSTEVMRPFTVQLVEIYNQIEDLPEDLVSNLYFEIADKLSLKEGPSDYLRAYNNPNNSEAKAVKNVIKYFFEQQGRQQTGYMNFNSVDNMYLDNGQMYSYIDEVDSVAAYVGEIMQNNVELFLPNSTEPIQLLNSVRPFEMVSQPFPLEISGDYINEYNKIIGTPVIENPTVSNKTVEAFADMNNLVTGEPLTIGEIAKELELPERLHTIDLPSTPTNVVDLDEVISQSDGVDNLNKSKEIMQKNPGLFRKVFSVLEKLDIGDQIITKAVTKGLPALGLAAAAPGAAIAYGAYEMSILLTDAAQAYNKMQTTDEGFWENFGELSDKYSIAYKISKPVYDIILDSLNDDLTTEGQDEEILFSFNR